MIKISLCMITKNEEKNIEECLDMIKQYVDEIVIIDTGSTDKTKEIASKFTNKIYDYKWNSNFSAARNYSISKASNDFVLIIDGDEMIQSFDRKLLNDNILNHQMEVGKIGIINQYTRKGIKYEYNERISRFFHKKYFEYQGKIHEQIVPISDVQSVKTYNIPVVVNHCGYDGDINTIKQKTKRNLNILLSELNLSPKDPYLLYQVGKSYYMEEDYMNALEYFGQGLLIDLDIRLEYVQDMVVSYGYSLLNSNKYESAMQLLNLYDEFADSGDYVFLVALILMNNAKFNEAIEQFLRATEASNFKMVGVNNYLSYYNIGVIYECLENYDCALMYYKKCNSYSPALKRVEVINNM